MPVPRYIPKKKLLLFFGDMIIVVLSFLTAAYLIAGPALSSEDDFALKAAVITMLMLYTLYVGDLYEDTLRFRSAKYFLRFVFGVGASVFILAVVFFIIPELDPGRRVFLACVLTAGALAYCWRLFLEWYLGYPFKRPRRILVAGAGASGSALYSMVKKNPAFKVVGFVDDDPKKHGVFNSPEVFGDHTVLNRVVDEHAVNTLVIAIRNITNPELIRRTLECKMRGVQVLDMAVFYEQLTGRIPVEHVDDHWFVNGPMQGVRKNVYNRKIKRGVDVLCAGVGLGLTMPVILAAAAAIKLDSKGPVLYKQRREGQDGRVFEVIKFRSMRTDAEPGGAVWASENDERVTGVGRVIRKLRIDEIPQMWNVLKGEMSLIGPRPERPEFVAQLKEKIPHYGLRHSVKPGLTGWAQVNYPYGASEKDALEKLQFDLFYIKNHTPLLDLHILLRTVKVVLFGKGAR